MAIAEDAATVLEQFVHDGNMDLLNNILRRQLTPTQSRICRLRLPISTRKYKPRTIKFKSCALQSSNAMAASRNLSN